VVAVTLPPSANPSSEKTVTKKKTTTKKKTILGKSRTEQEEDDKQEEGCNKKERRNQEEDPHCLSCNRSICRYNKTTEEVIGNSWKECFNFLKRICCNNSK
tara:strand:+ start:88 stop:390 length:303 start_codon:yes stop_codon:yes gene_type:complete